MGVKYRLVGRVAGTFIRLSDESLLTVRRSTVGVSFAGFEGDKHSGMTRRSDSRNTKYYPRGTEIHNDRQISIVSVEELELIAEKLAIPELAAEWLGANLLLEGVPKLTQLPPSTRLYFPHDTTLIVREENLPCIHPGKIIQKQYSQPRLVSLFPKAAIHRRGVVACVEKPGVINEGDQVIVEVPEQVLYVLDQEVSLLNFCRTSVPGEAVTPTAESVTYKVCLIPDEDTGVIC